MRRLFIVRHGNTFGPGEPPRRVGVRTDVPLVASGELQAAALGAWFAKMGISFDRALSGPLIRTRQTADAILSASPAPCTLETAHFLAEIDHGPDENGLEEEVVARVGHDAIRQWDELARPPEGWIVDAEARIAAWRNFFSADASENVLLVTSNGAARFALLAAEYSGKLGSLKLRTGAYGEIVKTDQNIFRIENWDQRPPS
ncbi:phosphoglycerate mutase [Sphingobium yanoikuyae]|uniref:Phosphoglycerate mutase n=1 Tax=Sphingobium yanoikuyae TaxID=13690 RepID=A0A177JB51_SPHYA|nr:histidine phosphatase family protein [Sphingobium yanoikuyae]OAH38147.1 phosphoglycerate mutase [Sphingobium yanoikuyae]